jgi:hypothetical protein
MSSADDIMAAFNVIAGALNRHARYWEDQLAAGAPPKALVYDAVDVIRYIAAVTGGDTEVTPGGATWPRSSVERYWQPGDCDGHDHGAVTPLCGPT